MYDRMTIFEDHLVRDINAGVCFGRTLCMFLVLRCLGAQDSEDWLDLEAYPVPSPVLCSLVLCLRKAAGLHLLHIVVPVALHACTCCIS